MPISQDRDAFYNRQPPKVIKDTYIRTVTEQRLRDHFACYSFTKGDSSCTCLAHERVRLDSVS
jgi:hypothetical protein